MRPKLEPVEFKYEIPCKMAPKSDNIRLRSSTVWDADVNETVICLNVYAVTLETREDDEIEKYEYAVLTEDKVDELITALLYWKELKRVQDDVRNEV